MMPLVHPFVLVPYTGAEHHIIEERTFPRELGGVKSDAVTVLPYSDSIRSTRTDATTSSWMSSSSSSTFATSVTSSLGKLTSTIRSGLDDIIRLNRPSKISQWDQEESWPGYCGQDVDFGPGASLPLQTLDRLRTDSTCEHVGVSNTEESAAMSIRLIFHFKDRSHAHELEYPVFRQWKYMRYLISAVQEDGVSCALLWDEIEGLQVTAGDWEARARPGWQVTMFCDHIDVYHNDDGHNDDESDEEYDEVLDEEKGYVEEWWFNKWKTRVENRREGTVKRRKSWLVGGVPMVVLLVAFGTVALMSLTKHRAVVMD